MRGPESQKVWQQVQDLFDQLVDLEPETQAQTLSNIEDDETRNWVSKLLIADAQENGLLDRSVESLTNAVFDSPISSVKTAEDESLIGMQFGAYRIISELGRGGMSVVMLAERSDGLFEKQVALKLIKPGPLEQFTNDRLDAETRILAQLQHPNIAHLLDAGVNEDGIAFTALEYCEGLSLTQYCDENSLSIKQRLQLLITICDAVHEAHKNLIVHRDLKPSNILVQKNGVVKLLDFGISSMLDDSGSSGKTAQGFTPEYAAPEQFNNTNVNTASDIYALGALGYELLTGKRPFDPSEMRNADAREKLRQKKLAGEFLLPSNKVKNLIATDLENAKTFGSQRGFRDPLKWSRKLAGDLDFICAKAMAAEPAQRYSGAQAFIQDIRAYLDGLPTTAHPQSLAYRISKTWLRHRFAIAAGAVITLSLLIGLFTSTHQARIAERNALRAESVKTFVLDLFGAADPVKNQLKPLSVNDLIDIGIENIKSSLTTEPSVKADFLTVLGDIQTNLGNYQSAILLQRQALQIIDSENLPITMQLAALSGLYRATHDSLQYPKAFRITEQLVDLMPIANGVTSDAVQARNWHTDSLIHMQQFDKAAQFTSNTLSYRKQIEQSPQAARMLSDTLYSMSRIKVDSGEYLTATSYSTEALTYAIEGYGKISGETALVLAQQAREQASLGAYDESLRLRLESLAIVEQIYPLEHYERLHTLLLVAVAYSRTGNFEKAFEYYDLILPLQIDNFGRQARNVGITLMSRAHTLASLGRNIEAIENFQEALQVLDHVGEAERFTTGRHHCGLAGAYSGIGDYELAISQCLKGVNILENTIGRNHPTTQRHLAKLAMFNWQAGKSDDGLPLIVESHPAITQHFGANTLYAAQADLVMGLYKLGLGKVNAGKDLLDSAHAVLSLPQYAKTSANALATIAEQRTRYNID